jgi:SAM-dependent methyltransferase
MKKHPNPYQIAAMTTATFDAQTSAYYAAHAEDYLGARPDTTSRHLDAFLKLLRPGAHILELGCGAGRDAEAMLKAGFRVEATDGTAEVARIAEQRLGQHVRVVRFDELDAIDAYDAIWCNASLLHVPRAELPDALQRIWSALRPGGYHAATFKSGGVEGRDERGRYYNYLSRDQAIECYTGAADWQIVSALDYQAGGRFEVKPGPWIAITVRKSTS